MTETKNEAFHRLAQARKEALLEKIRLFGQLSGPTYEWTQDEVWAYFSEITQALEQALGRFQEQKHWSIETSTAHPPAAAAMGADAVEQGTGRYHPEPVPEPIPAEHSEPEDPGVARERRRRRSIGELIQAAKNDADMLPEMLIFQKEVIANLQRSLDEARTSNRAGHLS